MKAFFKLEFEHRLLIFFRYIQIVQFDELEFKTNADFLGFFIST